MRLPAWEDLSGRREVITYLLATYLFMYCLCRSGPYVGAQEDVMSLLSEDFPQAGTLR